MHNNEHRSIFIQLVLEMVFLDILFENDNMKNVKAQNQIKMKFH